MNKTRYEVDPYRRMIIDLKEGMAVCDVSDAARYFGKKSTAIKKQVDALEKQINILENKKEKLMNKCKHNNAVREYKGNTGNYDPSRDSYWIEYRCYDCGKFWTTDQS
jgi:hypothetical protein